MADKNKDSSSQKGSQGGQQQKPFKDLDAKKDDGKNVKGGAARRFSADPCEGGERM